MSEKTTPSFCRSCNDDTNHQLLYQHEECHEDGHQFETLYQIVKCMGCNTTSFREVFNDIGSAYLVSEGEWEVPSKITIYPKFIKGHSSLDDDYLLPPYVSRIYRETLVAFKESTPALAGLGLRALIEAICTDRGIDGPNLKGRISTLLKNGLISTTDESRLHGIRFLGNDAAHETFIPKPGQLKAALMIVEHLIYSIYVIEKEAVGKIDTTIKTFSELEPIIRSKCNLFSFGDELPLQEILGKDIRRLASTLTIKDVEKEINVKINNGGINYLQIGKQEKYNESKSDLQHYILII